MTKEGLAQARKALEHVKNAPISPDGMRSPEEPLPQPKSDGKAKPMPYQKPRAK